MLLAWRIQHGGWSSSGAVTNLEWVYHERMMQFTESYFALVLYVTQGPNNHGCDPVSVGLAPEPHGGELWSGESSEVFELVYCCYCVVSEEEGFAGGEAPVRQGSLPRFCLGSSGASSAGWGWGEINLQISCFLIGSSYVLFVQHQELRWFQARVRMRSY